MRQKALRTLVVAIVALATAAALGIPAALASNGPGWG
jgi:ABC-type spermidine/putrescine transport system permease subunit II